MDASTSSHLRLLSIFHYVLAGVAALLSLVPIVHIGIGAGIVSRAFDAGGPSPPPAALGWLLVALGAMLMLLGFSYAVLVALAGRFLARMRHWTFCLVVAALSCVFFPLGTALGAFTIIVLARPEVKPAFDAGGAA